MTEITFEPGARAIYNQVLSKAASEDERDALKKVFSHQATLGNSRRLSKREAQEINTLLSRYDRTTSYQIGIYNSAEVSRVVMTLQTVDKARRLFADYSANHSPIFLGQLRATIKTAEQQGIYHSKLIELSRRINPDLDPEDHALIYMYQSARDKSERRTALKLISKRLKTLTRQDLLKYDGIVSTDKSPIQKRISAFMSALESSLRAGDARSLFKTYNKASFKIYLSYKATLNDPSFLPSSMKNIRKKRIVLARLRRLLRSGSTNPRSYRLAILRYKDTFLNVIEDASYALQNARLGSRDKIAAYRRFRLLYAIASISGIQQKEFNIRSIISSMPGIDLRYEFPILSDFSSVLDSPEKVDDYLYRNTALDQIRRVSHRLVQIRQQHFNHPSPSAQLAFRSMQGLLSTYIDFAARFGCDQAKITEILNGTGIMNPPESRSITNLNDVNRNGTVSISPNDLPGRIATILKSIGVFEDICMDVNNLYLAREIDSPIAHRIIGDNPGGEAITPSRSIWIDVIDRKGKPYSPFQIAATIVHEWLHIKWGIGNFNNRELLRSLPNERNSFLGEARYMQSYLRNYIQNHLKQIKEFEKLNKSYPKLIEYVQISRSLKHLDSARFRVAEARLKELDPYVKKHLITWDSVSRLYSIFETVDRMAETIYISKITGLAANKYLGLKPSDTSLTLGFGPNLEELDLDTYPTNLNGKITERRLYEGRNKILRKSGYPSI